MMRGELKLFLSNATELHAAARLLGDDNLVWSEDFDYIRKDLAAWLTDEARKGNHASIYALKVAKELNRSL